MTTASGSSSRIARWRAGTLMGTRATSRTRPSCELWDWLFDLGLYLNYDPSHLVWLGIDPVDALRSCLKTGRVIPVQAKDIEVDPRCLTRYGIFGKTVARLRPEDTGWWRYRVPGRGQFDWNRIVDTLYTGGFDGAVAVEHEDPVWGG